MGVVEGRVRWAAVAAEARGHYLHSWALRIGICVLLLGVLSNTLGVYAFIHYLTDRGVDSLAFFDFIVVFPACIIGCTLSVLSGSAIICGVRRWSRPASVGLLVYIIACSLALAFLVEFLW